MTCIIPYVGFSPQILDPYKYMVTGKTKCVCSMYRGERRGQ
uniref:Uncharacterized protein n=1 Tax=Arundo donax TaxID=35708 RepID=A0A0A9H9J6_ARUDO